jgi:3-dehydroquinate dehydratase-2
MLGVREPDIYGTSSFQNLLALLDQWSMEYQVEITQFQSNHEGVLVDQIQHAYGRFDGIIINPAAYTHTSIAILDALKAVAIPCVEVHISDISSREPFRQFSYIALACEKTISGQGLDGYRLALKHLIEKYGHSY